MFRICVRRNWGGAAEGDDIHWCSGKKRRDEGIGLSTKVSWCRPEQSKEGECRRLGQG